MGILLIFLCLIIAGYTYLTDSDRVRLMAQGYLSNLIHGRVEIGKATLSIFQGLRLDDVKVSVDANYVRPDSLLFSAQSLVVNYDPRKLLAGTLDATEIVTHKPHVYLTFTQSVRGDRWNYDRLGRSEAPTRPTTPIPPPRLSLPALLLRNAVVEISELKAGRRVKVGSMAVDGQFTPASDREHYQFELQSRGLRLGPYANGSIDANSGKVTAHLRNVEFGEDLRSMFPADLRDWWQRHELSGRIESVDISYTPSQDRRRDTFSIQTVVQAVTLAVRREEWSGRADIDRLGRIENAIELLRGPAEAAGFRPLRLAENLPLARASQSDIVRIPKVLTPLENMLTMVDAAPLLLREVSGVFVFTQDGIDVNNLLVRVGTGDPRSPQGTNAFRIDGHMNGYRPDAPLRLTVSSADEKGLYFPAHPSFLNSLPRDVRDFYEDLQPEGTCRVTAQVSRPTAGAVPQVSAVLEVLDAKFLFRQFPYPFRNAAGKIAYGRDPFSGKNYVSVLNMHAVGIPGGPNENSQVAISGRVGPIGPDEPESGFELKATATNICSEPQLMKAMPPEVRQALRIFDAPGKGEFPKFRGNFACDIRRPTGHDQPWKFDTDVDLLDASGSIVDFPYPCPHVEGKLTVHNNNVEIKDITITNRAARAKVTGVVRWADDTGHGQPLDMKVKIAARSLPVDQELINAIPLDQRQWLKKLGVGGKINCDGEIYTIVPANWRNDLIPGQKPKDPPVQYDLAIGVHDGTLWPQDGLFTVSGVEGTLHLTPRQLDILELDGRRDGATVAATGQFTFDGKAPKMSLHVSAKGLALDHPLYSMLPIDGRRAWDEVQPEGRVDAKVDYEGPIGPAPSQPVASAASAVELPMNGSFRAELIPRELRVRVRTAPYPLTFESGSVTVVPGKAVLKDLKGSHGAATLVVSGAGSLDVAPRWDLNIHGENFVIDPELKHAMPPMLLGIIDAVKLGGSVNLDFPKFSYHGTGSAADPDIDVSGTVTVKNGTMDAGMPLTGIDGGMKLTAGTRQGRLETLDASVLLDSLNLGGRALHSLKLDLAQPSRNELRVTNIQGRVAEGELAGSFSLSFPDSGPSRYSMNLIVRNADVQSLTGESDEKMRGELTASLALEGAWGDVRGRRGRGDVVVVGKELYRVPVVLGALQITNLSLPISGPFTRGTARYDVEGSRINFEQLALQSDTMMMTGTGYLDFATRQVRMTLATDNPSALKVPFLHELWQGARQELLKINLRGTIQEPKVQPTSMGTFTTTIDQVFKGDSAGK